MFEPCAQPYDCAPSHAVLPRLQMGCAQLSLVPPAATIEACVAAVEQQGQRSNGREAANVAWALATLEVCVGLLAHVLDAKGRSQVPLLGRLMSSSLLLE